MIIDDYICQTKSESKIYIETKFTRILSFLILIYQFNNEVFFKKDKNEINIK